MNGISLENAVEGYELGKQKWHIFLMALRHVIKEQCKNAATELIENEQGDSASFYLLGNQFHIYFGCFNGKIQIRYNIKTPNEKDKEGTLSYRQDWGFIKAQGDHPLFYFPKKDDDDAITRIYARTFLGIIFEESSKSYVEIDERDLSLA
ncbi:hypothetical protein CA11_33140 [Gimesia maris]|uniref:hypothetical protein n=1 Tax=Gimesia maris TaxID=122 RepID=UPI00118A1B52|nr:hypothetical protein [Gimesia maris]QDU15489.1 hypothetical protein CA11_33140 [Gimesia maris]